MGQQQSCSMDGVENAAGSCVCGSGRKQEVDFRRDILGSDTWNKSQQILRWQILLRLAYCKVADQLFSNPNSDEIARRSSQRIHVTRRRLAYLNNNCSLTVYPTSDIIESSPLFIGHRLFYFIYFIYLDIAIIPGNVQHVIQFR